MDFGASMRREPEITIFDSPVERGALIQLTSGIAGNIQPNPAIT